MVLKWDEIANFYFMVVQLFVEHLSFRYFPSSMMATKREIMLREILFSSIKFFSKLDFGKFVSEMIMSRNLRISVLVDFEKLFIR